MGSRPTAAHVRHNTSITAATEKRLLHWLATRMPERVNSDHLSALGLGAMACAGLAFAGFRLSPWAALGVFVALALNWFGDSLDGTTARVRKIQRPRYGFYLDHLTDAFSTIAIGLGLGLSPYMLLSVGLAIVAGYLVLSINVYLESQVLGDFRFGYGVMGPTETRLLLMGLNTAAVLVGPRPFNVFGVGATVFDLFGVVAVAGMMLMLSRRVARNLGHLARLEPANTRQRDAD